MNLPQDGDGARNLASNVPQGRDGARSLQSKKSEEVQ